MSDAEKKRRSLLSTLAWWKTDPAEVAKQVDRYETLKLWQSARGISLLLCLFSVTVTVLLGGMMKMAQGEIITETVIWGLLGVLMFRGRRWAFVVGMILWTVEKGLVAVNGVTAGITPIVQIIWWAIYLNAFMLGFRVEDARKRKLNDGMPAPVR